MDAMLVISIAFMLQGLPVQLSSIQFIPWTDKPACEAWLADPTEMLMSISHGHILDANMKCFTKTEFEIFEKEFKEGKKNQT